jgi:mRNA interferase MazF
MAKFVKGDVVILNFPFSDLSGSKRRPALVFADLQGDDVLLCQITSQSSNEAIGITSVDFTNGSLPTSSYIKPFKIFTADQNIFIRTAGHLNNKITTEVITKIVKELEK